MFTISVRNVQEALPLALAVLNERGVKRDSRNGDVVMMPMPVTTVYHKPNERVIFHEERDANPFFHLFEALWMLAGRNDVEYPATFAANMRSFSDDGKSLHGAYGYRWRQLFGGDQLELIAERLRANKDDRRQVVQMFDAQYDLRVEQKDHRDIPCNLTATFQVNTDGALDLNVFCRSNDIVWGCYGANAVHFSVLLEYMAAWVGVPVGRYYQTSVNWHGYLTTLDPLETVMSKIHADENGAMVVDSPYSSEEVEVFPLVKDINRFNLELPMAIDEPFAIGFQEPFFRKIFLPMARAHMFFRNEEGTEKYEAPLRELATMPLENDWRLACEEWITRRKDKWVAKVRAEDDGVVDYD